MKYQMDSRWNIWKCALKKRIRQEEVRHKKRNEEGGIERENGNQVGVRAV